MTDMILPRRGILAAAALAGSAGLAPRRAAAQAEWPMRPVRLIVGFTAGSSTDVTARLFAQRFAEYWGQPVVVENVAGNGGAIGIDRVAKAAPDGYTLAWGANGALTILPSMQKLPFDPLKDLAPIGRVLSMASLILANNDFPARGIQDLVAKAKSEPGKLSFGSPGVGTPQHIAGEMLCRQAGIRMEHIPYRGAALADTLSGIVPIAIQNAGASLPMVRDGLLRCLGITSLERATTAPGIPTVAEQGFPGFEVTSWFGLAAPAGTPAPVLARVHEAALRVLAEPEAKARIASLGLEIVGGSGEDMRQTIARDIPKWARVLGELQDTPR